METVTAEIRPIEDEEIIDRTLQTVKVRNHLYRYGSITDAQARELYSIARLADVIYKLRRKKEPLMDIKTFMVYGRNKYGRPTRYARYYI